MDNDNQPDEIAVFAGFEATQGRSHVTPADGQRGGYALKASPTDPACMDWAFGEGEPVLIDSQASFTKSRYVRLAVWLEEDGTLRVRWGQWGEMVDVTLDEPAP